MNKTEEIEFQGFVIDIGKNIVRLREQKGLKQKELAYRMDIDDGSLRRIESGRTNPTLKIIYRIAKALEIEPWEVLKLNSTINKR